MSQNKGVLEILMLPRKSIQQYSPLLTKRFGRVSDSETYPWRLKLVQSVPLVFFALTETARFILFHKPTNFQLEHKVILNMPYPKHNIYIAPPHINALENTCPKI